MTTNLKNPLQPVCREPGDRPRFKENKIVRFMLESENSCNLNEIRTMYSMGMFSTDDLLQFYQLIGYTTFGMAELSFVEEAVKNGEFPDPEKL